MKSNMGVMYLIMSGCSGPTRKHRPMIYPWPDGLLGSIRLEMLREGLQEMEARAVVERALVEDTLDEKTAEEARELLTEMFLRRFRNGIFTGGHAGNTLGRADHMWGFAPYPDWMNLNARLFEMAAGIVMEEEPLHLGMDDFYDAKNDLWVFDRSVEFTVPEDMAVDAVNVCIVCI